MRRLDARVQGRAVVIVQLRAETDLASPDRARCVLDGCLRPGAEVVILDLSRVTVLDCSVMTVQVGFADRCAQTGTRLILAGVGPSVRRVLMALDLYRVFTIVPSLWDAARLASDHDAWAGRVGVGCASGVSFS